MSEGRTWMISLALIIAGRLALVPAGIAQMDVVFESGKWDMDAWDCPDLKGDGDVGEVTDLTASPGYGPEVLDLRGAILRAGRRGVGMSEDMFLNAGGRSDPAENRRGRGVLFSTRHPRRPASHAHCSE